MRYFLASITLHLIFLWPYSKPLDEVIEVVIKAVVKKTTTKGAQGIDTGAERKRAKEEQESGEAERKNLIYSNYIERIKENIVPIWRAEIKKKVNPLPKLPHTTDLYIIIDATGHVTQVILVNSSGIDGMDEACIKVFVNNIFPNPPKGLIEKDGYGRLYWSFNIP